MTAPQMFSVQIQLHYSDGLVEVDRALGDPDDGEEPFRSYVEARIAGLRVCKTMRETGTLAKDIFPVVYRADDVGWDRYSPTDAEVNELRLALIGTDLAQLVIE
jgi:hypothetical protein